MEKYVVEELVKEMNFKERILLKLFKRTFVKAYNIARVNTFNNIVP